MKKNQTVLQVAEKPLDDHRMIKLILSEDSKKLDTFITQFGDPGRDLYLVHTRRGKFITIKKILEHPLGFNCPACGDPVCRYAGEWQERVHCSCTMLLLPLDLDELAREMTLDAWIVTIDGAQQGLTKI